MSGNELFKQREKWKTKRGIISQLAEENLDTWIMDHWKAFSSYMKDKTLELYKALKEVEKKSKNRKTRRLESKIFLKSLKKIRK